MQAFLLACAANQVRSLTNEYYPNALHSILHHEHECILICMHTYIYTILTCIHTYIYVYMHIYIYTSYVCSPPRRRLSRRWSPSHLCRTRASQPRQTVTTRYIACVYHTTPPVSVHIHICVYTYIQRSLPPTGRPRCLQRTCSLWST